MSDESIKSPDERLAELIIEKLRAQGVIPEKRSSELKEKIIKGTVRQEDWRSLIELAMPKAEAVPQESTDEKPD